MNRYRIALVSLATALAAVFAAPEAHGAEAESTTPPTAESPWRLGIALGYGRRSNPLALSDDIPIVVDLDVAWFGRRWFFDNGDIGVTVLDRPLFTLNLVGRLNSDRVFFGKTDSDVVSVLDPGGVVVTQTVEVPDRDYAFELGIELLTDGRWGYLQAAAHRAVSGQHDGYELYLNVGRGFRRHRFLLEPSFGVSWKSAKLNDYYWGVDENEANLVFPAYRAGSGLNRHARLLASYQLDTHWALVAVVDYERLNSEAAASPLVEERDVIGYYAGVKYGF